MIFLNPEQIDWSQGNLADQWKLYIGRVARFIDALKTDTMIDTANGTGRTVVTIYNYDTYQDRGLENGTANGTATGTATGHSRVHIQEGKELKELKKPPYIPPGDPDMESKKNWHPLLKKQEG